MREVQGGGEGNVGKIVRKVGYASYGGDYQRRNVGGFRVDRKGKEPGGIGGQWDGEAIT